MKSFQLLLPAPGLFRPTDDSDRTIQTGKKRSEPSVSDCYEIRLLSHRSRKRTVQTAFYRSEQSVLDKILKTFLSGQIGNGRFRPVKIDFTGLNRPLV